MVLASIPRPTERDESEGETETEAVLGSFKALNWVVAEREKASFKNSGTPGKESLSV